MDVFLPADVGRLTEMFMMLVRVRDEIAVFIDVRMSMRVVAAATACRTHH